MRTKIHQNKRAILFMACLTQFERNPSSQVPPDDLSIAGSAPQARVDPRLIRLPVIDATDNRVVWHGVWAEPARRLLGRSQSMSARSGSYGSEGCR
jgi:hypothetical protein